MGHDDIVFLVLVSEDEIAGHDAGNRVSRVLALGRDVAFVGKPVLLVFEGEGAYGRMVRKLLRNKGRCRSIRMIP